MVGFHVRLRPRRDRSKKYMKFNQFSHKDIEDLFIPCGDWLIDWRDIISEFLNSRAEICVSFLVFISSYTCCCWRDLKVLWGCIIWLINSLWHWTIDYVDESKVGFLRDYTKLLWEAVDSFGLHVVSELWDRLKGWLDLFEDDFLSNLVWLSIYVQVIWKVFWSDWKVKYCWWLLICTELENW